MARAKTLADPARFPGRIISAFPSPLMIDFGLDEKVCPFHSNTFNQLLLLDCKTTTNSSVPSLFKSLNRASTILPLPSGEYVHNKRWLPSSPNSTYSNWFDNPPRSKISLLPLLFRSSVPKTKRFPATKIPQVQTSNRTGNLIDTKLLPGC